MVMDMSIQDVPVACINQAAIQYHIPAPIILSILRVEGGRIGMANPNSNGTVDFGPMQINSLWLPELKPYGITRESLQYDPCVNVKVGTWILGQKIADSDNLWQGIASYHSKTPQKNHHYREKIITVYNRIMRAIHGPENAAAPGE